MLQIAIILFFPFLMIYACASDLFSMTISNKISVLLIVGFAVMALAIGMDYQTFIWHLAMFAIVLTIGFAMFAFGWVGGGDTKLAAATVLWIGWDYTLHYFLYAALLGGALTMIVLLVRMMPLPHSVTGIAWIGRLYRAGEGVPYGIALGISAILVYPQTLWMQYAFSTGL